MITQRHLDMALLIADSYRGDPGIQTPALQAAALLSLAMTLEKRESFVAKLEQTIDKALAENS